MPRNADGLWVPNLFPKQMEVFNCQKRYTLVSGPRKSGKTIAVLHRLVRHAWEVGRPGVPGAKIAFFSKTKKTAKEGGAWNDLLDFVLPEWFDGPTGIHFTTENAAGLPGPKVEADTKTPYFRLSNYWGTEAEIRLFSLDNDNEIESKLKQTRYSLIYFAELSNFEDRKAFTTSILQLRCLHIPPDQHMWLSDTNPSEDGEQSWIYQTWWQEKARENHPQPNFQAQLDLIEIFCEDNPWFTDFDREELMASCGYDDDLYNRYVKGLWTAGGTRKRHFSGLWKPNTHILGDVSDPDREKWEVALPSDGCTDLFTGWDLGDVNHAAVICEKVQSTPAYFVVLDELVYIKSHVTLEDFTLEFLAKIEAIEAHIGHPVNWHHWSDESALKRWRASVGAIDQLIVQAASGNKIRLDGCPKEPSSVIKRLSMVKRLVAKSRLLVSANCTHTIQMFSEIRRSTKNESGVLETDPMKHVLDALSYGLTMEMFDELQDSVRPNTGRLIVARR